MNYRTRKIGIYSLSIVFLLFTLVTGFTLKDTKPESTNTIVEEPVTPEKQETLPKAESKSKKIQIALLLDTSNSMDGLIEQAKSQLWKIVNELSKARCDGESPSVEIALYEYGNDRLSQSTGYIRQVAPLIGDLDNISTKLFELRTNGGQEYCGNVIKKATESLEWSSSDNDIKMIFIAGNEPFNQGGINYQTACGNARAKDIIINTIHCGDFEEGIRGSWKSGALIGGGDYMCIEQNQRTVYVTTPYDDRINTISTALNGTYIYYGSIGKSKKMEQKQADEQARSYNKSNLAIRNSVKASSLYKNAKWDLVDACKESDFDIKKVDKNTLPSQLQKISDKELEAYIQKQKTERESLKLKIKELNTEREKYIANNKEEGSESVETSMIKSLKKQAESKNYSW